MKILCSKTISPELMNKFKEDLRFIFRKHGHSMGNFNPKKTLYSSSNVPETAYKNDYVILSGPLHFYIDPNYDV